MKKTLNEISKKISQVAAKKRLDAGYSGEWGDGGASNLEKELEFFKLGVSNAMDMYLHLVDMLPNKHEAVKLVTMDNIRNFEIEIPKSWEGYFLKDDAEYQKYLELKNKFEGK